MNNIFNQLLWEKYFWITMQSYVYSFPEFPQKSDKKNIYNTFIHSGFLIPHENFRKNYFLYLENISIINFLDSKDNLMNYLHNLYVFIFNKTKEYILNNKNIKDTNEDEFIHSHFDKEPMNFNDFWSSYLKLYNPPPPSLTYEKLIYTQSLIYFIIIVFLLIFIFYIYKYEIRNFFTFCFRTFSL